MRLVQLITDLTEELWKFPNEVSDEDIREAYQAYEVNDAFDTFEEYLEEHYPILEGERVFVDEIYV